MWYLTEECSPLDSLIAGAALSNREMEELSLEAIAKADKAGIIFKETFQHKEEPTLLQWQRLSSRCCHLMPGAP
jgi:hypothetical protein